MVKANETLLDRVQKGRIERRRKLSQINEKRKLPSEIQENDVSWSEILNMGGKLVLGLIGFAIFLIALVSLAFFIPA